MTPQPNAPPSQPGWFSQNWKWLAGVGCLLAMMCCGLLSVVGWLTMQNLPPEPASEERTLPRDLDVPAGADAARVDCGTPGPEGVDCDVQRTGGSGAFKACWKLVITCANKGVMTGEGCGTVGVGEEQTVVNMPVSGFSNQEACDAPKAGVVKGLTVTTPE